MEYKFMIVSNLYPSKDFPSVFKKLIFIVSNSIFYPSSNT